MKRIAQVAVLAAVFALPQIAQAQSYRQALAQLEARFARSDKNNDGKLTKKEASDGGMTRVVANFEQVDTDRDGFVTLDQLRAMLAQRYQ